MTKKFCFVIMPFNAPYDERFDDTYKPGIEEAGLVAYRVDRDLAAREPVKFIHEKIEAAHICFAEISTDRHNVWYELGYARACRKELVLVCEEPRTTDLPFDLEKLRTIYHSSKSKSDFDRLKSEITAEVSAVSELADKAATAPVVGASTVAPSQSQGGAGEQLPEGWNSDMGKVLREIANSAMNCREPIDEDVLQKHFPNMVRYISSISKLEGARLISANRDEMSRHPKLGVREDYSLIAQIFSAQPPAPKSPFKGVWEELGQPSSSSASNVLKPAPKTAYGLTSRGVKFVLKHPSRLD